MRPIKILNVAEKNSVAKEVSRILSQSDRLNELNSSARFSKIYTFQFALNDTPADMLFTSVQGHLLSMDFVHPYKSWNAVQPIQLYSAPIEKSVTSNEGPLLKANLQRLARSAQWLILWLDCDREGESIAFEVIEVCKAVNPRLIIKRARFSALIHRDIFHAVNNLVEPDRLAAEAVDVRQELDLRIGASFTRFQTTLLQNRFDWNAYMLSQNRAIGEKKIIISYGPCQFPTLGLIVQREWEIKSHIFEDFWSITVQYREQDTAPGTHAGAADTTRRKQCSFAWRRGRIFDHHVARLYHDRCTTFPTATVLSVDGARRTFNPPYPLCTLEMQKKGSQHLRMSGERIMKLAEELYQGGFISYPRTETTVFAPGYDLHGLITAQAQSNNEWSTYAGMMMNNNGAYFRWPRDGGKDDGAHPPIHPTKPYQSEGNSEKNRLYEFIVRYFLACCSPQAEGLETKVAVGIAGEQFTTSGLMVTARNWLNVVPWQSWGGSEALPVFTQDQTFRPASIDLTHGSTQPPPRMRESDLLAKMDAYGIGTDATVADHIARQLDRGYAVKDDATMTFAPTKLGEALISAYKRMDLSNLWLPTLRGTIERNINDVARGRRSKEEVLHEAMTSFKADFEAATSKRNIFIEEVNTIVFEGAGGPPPPSNQQQAAHAALLETARRRGEDIGVCTCGGRMFLVPPHEDCGLFFVCSALDVGHMSNTMEIPSKYVRSVEVLPRVCQDRCASHGHHDRMKVLFRFNVSLLPPDFVHMGEYEGCIWCGNDLGRLTNYIRSTSGTAGGNAHNGNMHGGSRGTRNNSNTAMRRVSFSGHGPQAAAASLHSTRNGGVQGSSQGRGRGGRRSGRGGGTAQRRTASRGRRQ